MGNQIILAGLPGDMATRVRNVVDSTERIELVRERIALTGEKIKEVAIDERFISKYCANTGIFLIKPVDHEQRISGLREHHERLYGINAATAEGYGVNNLFVKYRIPFISMTTGASKEDESRLVEAVRESGINAIIDKNMSPALIVFGAMLKYGGEKFKDALTGYTGFGVDEHQASKAEGISGTLMMWGPFFRAMGIDFEPLKGSRKGDYGHADHFMRVSSPTGDVRLNWMTEVLGRDDYAKGAVHKGLPFLIQATEKGIKGKVYSMENALSLNY